MEKAAYFGWLRLFRMVTKERDGSAEFYHAEVAKDVICPKMQKQLRILSILHSKFTSEVI